MTDHYEIKQSQFGGKCFIISLSCNDAENAKKRNSECSYSKLDPKNQEKYIHNQINDLYLNNNSSQISAVQTRTIINFLQQS